MKLITRVLFALLVCWYADNTPEIAAAPPAKVVITPASFSEREGILIVAQNQGFFRRRNLDVQLVLMPSAPIAFSALTAEDAVEGYEFMRKMYTKRIYPTVDGIRNAIRVLGTTNEKFRSLKAEDLVDDRIVRKLERARERSKFHRVDRDC